MLKLALAQRLLQGEMDSLQTAEEFIQYTECVGLDVLLNEGMVIDQTKEFTRMVKKTKAVR